VAPAAAVALGKLCSAGKDPQVLVHQVRKNKMR
jgi:hypothetical protein